MGDRAVIQFVDASGAQGVSVYLHWRGGDVKPWLREAAPTMRRGDANYACARFVAYACERIPGGLSVGVIRDAFDPGDNGAFRVDCSTGKVQPMRADAIGDNDRALAPYGRAFTIKMGAF